jgi:hypothetical protein
VEPVDVIDLSVMIEECLGRFLIYRSPDTAEHSPEYELIAECGTREAADQWVRSECGEPEPENRVGFVD